VCRFDEVAVVFQHQLDLAVGQRTHLDVTSDAVGNRGFAQPEKT